MTHIMAKILRTIGTLQLAITLDPYVRSQYPPGKTFVYTKVWSMHKLSFSIDLAAVLSGIVGDTHVKFLGVWVMPLGAKYWLI